MCQDGFCLQPIGTPPPNSTTIATASNPGFTDIWYDDGAAKNRNNTGEYGDNRWTDYIVGIIKSKGIDNSSVVRTVDERKQRLHKQQVWGPAREKALAMQERPLFIYLALSCAHTPLQAPDSSLASFGIGENAGREHDDDKNDDAIYHDRRLYNGMMNLLDTNIGRVVDSLKATFQRTSGQNSSDYESLWASTIFVFLSDNGGPVYWNNENYTGISDWQVGTEHCDSSSSIY